MQKNLTRQLEREEHDAQARREALLSSVRDLIARAREGGWRGRTWVFGSYAWGMPGKSSDLDLLVDGDIDSVSTILSEHLRLPLHIVNLDAAPTSLRERVLDAGIPL